MQAFLNAIVSFFRGIFNGFIDWVVSCINALLSGLGDLLVGWLLGLGLTIEIPPNVFDILHELTVGVGYILPIRQLLLIPMFMLSFYVAKLIFAVFQVIYSTIIKRTTIKV